jgi:crossover junction endodeoxyribonuclease RusA
MTHTTQDLTYFNKKHRKLRDYTLPWPPSINHLYGRHGNRTFIKKAGVLYHKRTLEIVGKIFPFTGRLKLTIVVFEPDKRRRDLDNLLKITQDSLQKAGVFKDDSQIDHLLIYRAGYVTKPGHILVFVEELQTNENMDRQKRRKSNESTEVGVS